MMNIVRNPNNKFMERNLSTVIGKTLPLDVGLSAKMKIYYQIYMFTETHQEILYFKEIFSEHAFRIPRCPTPSTNHPATIDDTETTASRTPTSQDYSCRSAFSG